LSGILLNEYSNALKVFLVGIIISLLLICISVFLVYQKPEKEKMSAYECGFNPYGDARNTFEIQYFLVGILFIIFDLEIGYIFP
jgi:NADH-quinone oxidoreductase subunit A